MDNDAHKRLLIIAHTPSPNTQALAAALLAGAQDAAVTGVKCSLKSPFDCTHEDILDSDALLLFTTENFGYMSGALKDMFERVYYPCLEDSKRNDAMPYALVIRAGLDGTGTDIAVHKIIAGLKWREVQKALSCKGEHSQEFVTQCHELGLTMAASLEAGLF